MLEKVPIPIENFKELISQNSKILFSGVFGSGKTTFINDFFSVNEAYEAIHVFPVNYSVVSNKDIFELIKYDILFQLIGKIPREDFLKLEIPFHLTLYNYLFNLNDLSTKVDFLTSFLSFAGKYGSASLKVYEKLKYLKDSFIDFHNNFQEDDFKKIEDFLQNKTNEKGHIYEEDFFTELIRNLIIKLKENNKKEVVLVIDDLDRLDPEHIFRILNIFSAHIDFASVENDNKFDFDKVILVCDYANIESLFRHKYGVNTDFKGYINKFYDSIYWFDAASLIKGVIKGYFNRIKTNLDYNIFDDNYRFSRQLTLVMNVFLDLGIITFRDLIKYKDSFETNSFFQIKSRKLSSTESILRRNNLTSELTLDFLISFFNNNIELLKAIEGAEKSFANSPIVLNDQDYLDNIVELVLLISHESISKKGFAFKSETSIPIAYKSYVFDCNFDSAFRDYTIYINCKKVKYENSEISSGELNYFHFLKEAMLVYFKLIK